MVDLKKTKHKGIYRSKDDSGNTYHHIRMMYPDGSIRTLKTKEPLHKAREIQRKWVKERAIFRKQLMEDTLNQNLEGHMKMFTLEFIGKNISVFRRFHGLTVREFAKILGMSPSHITMIEKGQRKLPIDKLWLLSRTFHVKPEKFFSGFGVKIENMVKDKE